MKRSSKDITKEVFKKVGIAFVILITVIIVIIAAIDLIFDNRAKAEFEKIFKDRLSRVNAELICTNGDGGYGPDNYVPWYTAYYLINDSSELVPSLKSSAQKHGYHLHKDKEFIKRLKRIPDKDGNLLTPYGNEKFHPNATYLTADNQDKDLDIKVIKDAPVALYCDDIQDYGKKQLPEPGTVIVEMSLSLPSRK